MQTKLLNETIWKIITYLTFIIFLFYSQVAFKLFNFLSFALDLIEEDKKL